MDYVEKTRRKNEARKRRQMEKNAAKEKPKTDTKSFVKSLKKKSKKILNSSKKKGRPSKKGLDNGLALTDQHMAYDERPPPLQRQTDGPTNDEHSDDAHTSSATDINSSEPDVAKSSAPLCARYLKACEELSRKLSKYQLTQDEMIACFKYSMVRDCLGDVELAAQKIAFGTLILNP